MKIVSFQSASDFRKWLASNHDKVHELWVGFYKKKSGKVGVSYSEAVDEALCFGWIDGLKKAADDVSQARKNKRCRLFASLLATIGPRSSAVPTALGFLGDIANPR